MNATPRNSIHCLLFAAGLALALPLSAYAEPHMPPAPCDAMPGLPPGAAMPPPFLRGIALSDAQRDKLFDLMHGQEPALRDRANALRKAETDLRALVFAADFTEARAKAAVDAVARAQGEMAAARLRLDRQVVDLLMPEQRRQVQERRPSREGGDFGPPPRR